MDLYAEDAVQVMPDGTFEGWTAVRERLAQELDGFTELTTPCASFVDEGDLFADEWTFVGTHTGPFRLPDGTWLPPTGRPVALGERAAPDGRFRRGTWLGLSRAGRRVRVPSLPSLKLACRGGSSVRTSVHVSQCLRLRTPRCGRPRP